MSYAIIMHLLAERIIRFFSRSPTGIKLLTKTDDVFVGSLATNTK